MEQMVDSCASCVAAAGMVQLLLAGFTAALLCAELRSKEPSRGLIAFQSIVLLGLLAWAFIATGSRLQSAFAADGFQWALTLKLVGVMLLPAGAAGWVLSTVRNYRWRDLASRRLVVFLGVLAVEALLLWATAWVVGYILG